MDVVKTNISKAGGTVDIQNNPGSGSTTTIILPQTLSIITALLISSAERRFALPQQNIKRLIKFNVQSTSTGGNITLYNTGTGHVPLYKLSDLLHLKHSGAAEGYVAVVRSEKHCYALLIDSIINTEEIVIKPLGNRFSDVETFSGATIMGDGEAVLILDIEGIARKAEVPELEEKTETTDEEADEGRLYTVRENNLVFTYRNVSFTVPAESKPYVRKLHRSHIQELPHFHTVSLNNRVTPIILPDRHTRIYEGAGALPEIVYIILYTYRSVQIALASDTVPYMKPSIEIDSNEESEHEAISGTAIIDDTPVFVIDTEVLFDTFLAFYHDTISLSME